MAAPFAAIGQEDRSARLRVRVEVWSDVVCPWCYVGVHRLKAAIAQSPAAASMELVTRSFVLDPDALRTPRATPDVVVEKKGTTPERAVAMERRMRALASSEGLPYELNRPYASTVDMHRMLHLAAESGVRNELMGVLQLALFSGESDVFSPECLVAHAVAAGVPEEPARDVLRTDRYADTIAEDQREAIELGITGVPFVVIDRRVGIPGAASTETYASALAEAWERRS